MFSGHHFPVYRFKKCQKFGNKFEISQKFGFKVKILCFQFYTFPFIGSKSVKNLVLRSKLVKNLVLKSKFCVFRSTFSRL